MEGEKRKFDLFVHGNIAYHGYCSSGSIESGATVMCGVPYEEVDLMHGIVVEGDMEVENIYTVNKKVGVSGDIYWIKDNQSKNGDKEENNV